MAKKTARKKTAPTVSVSAEIVAAAGVTRRPKATDQKWFAQLVRAVLEVDPEVWDELSEEAQLWVNANATLMNDKEPLLDFSATKDELLAVMEDEDEDAEEEDDEDEDEDEEDAEEDEEDEEDEDEEDAEEDEEDEEDEDENAEEDEEDEEDEDEEDEEDEDEDEDEEEDEEDEEHEAPKAKKRGAGSRFVELLLQSPSSKSSEIRDLVRAEGYEMSDSTASVAYYSATSVTKALAAAGMLKDPDFEISAPRKKRVSKEKPKVSKNEAPVKKRRKKTATAEVPVKKRRKKTAAPAAPVRKKKRRITQ